MTTFVCAISGEAAEHPVVSPVSGEIFEKRLVTKYIADNGTDPINGEKLSEDQLVELRLDKAVRASHRSLATASLPQLLKTLQDEWDATMLNNFNLRQNLKAAREELTHALYQNDAACRVINRLTAELQSARQILATLPHGRAAAEPDALVPGGTDVEMPEEEDRLPGISDAIISKLQDKAAEFTAARKQRGKNLPPGLAPVDDIKRYAETASHTGIHSASVPGITSLDLQNRFALTGGVDKTVVMFNLDTETVESTFKGHQKKVTSVVLHPNKEIVASAAADAQVRIWNKNEENARYTITVHDKPISEISLHPIGEYLLSASEDSRWALTDLRAGRALATVRSDDEGTPICCAQFHPDGLIFGTGGRDSAVKIWDLKEQSNVAKFPGHRGDVRSLSFSENGYYLATGDSDGDVKIFDLRKLKLFKSMQIGEGDAPINRVAFDSSGAYLAIAGADINVVHVKTWSVVARFQEHSAPVTGVCFGDDAKFIVSCSADKTLRVFSLPGDEN
ncbi:nuclear matrix protein SNEV, partial [Aphelenchoides avenae]